MPYMQGSASDAPRPEKALQAVSHSLDRVRLFIRPVISMDEQSSDHSYTPTERADVDRRKSAKHQQRPRKFPDGKKLRKKNAHGLLEYVVTIVNAVYDTDNHTWMYVLNDWEGKPIAGRTEETELG